ncbi:MAG: hypothetical protein KKH28_12330 [Elusimicrobia bacterium]|nr:hypothetical protein [Elusimicrobiota bacterium]
MNNAVIKIPFSRQFTAPAVGFILACARELKAEEGKIDLIKRAAEFIISLLVEKNSPGDAENKLSIDVSEADGKMAVKFFNRGIPIFLSAVSDRESDRAFISEFYEAARGMDNILVDNLGRHGQKITIETALGGASAAGPGPDARQREEIHVKDEDIEIRPLKAGSEEHKLSRLFHSVYGYNYINEFVYYPGQLGEMIKQGRLVSIVAALPNGRLVGHVGLVKWGESPPVYEAALGLVDPLVKSKGLFGKIFRKTMEHAKETPMQYCFFDFVTNHDFSQKLISKYGIRDMALFVGCQTKATQARLEKLGIGRNPADMDRYTILLSIIPGVERPFGKNIKLPASLGESLEFLLKPLNLAWLPEPRFSTLPGGGKYESKCSPLQGAVSYDLTSPGRAALEEILAGWRELLRNGYQYASVDIPIGNPGLGNAHNILAASGFFIAGLVPYRYSDKLAFRFQAVAPARIALDKIKVASENSRKLLELIKADYQRNCLI